MFRAAMQAAVEFYNRLTREVWNPEHPKEGP